jgi:hypothetical protein
VLNFKPARTPARRSLRNLSLEFKRQFLAARPHDAAVQEDVHEIGHDVIEQALIMGDDKRGVVGRRSVFTPWDTTLSASMIEAGIGFVEDRQRGSSTAI